MSNMDLQQSLRSMAPAAVLAGFVFEPFWFCGCLLLIWWARKRYDDSLLFKIAVGVNVVNLLLMLIPQEVSVLAGTSVPMLIAWLFGYSPIRMIVPALVLLMLLYTDTRSADEMILDEHRAYQLQWWSETDHIPVESARTHIFTAGTTGAGKTTALLHYVKDSIEKGEPLYIVSGKNGAVDPKSLLSSTRRLAEQAGREVLIVSLNESDPNRKPYNPLAAMSPTEVADALVAISEYTEPHYKACTTTWIKAIAECLALAGIPFSLSSICDFYSFDNFSMLISNLKKEKKIKKEEAAKYLDLREIAKEAALSESRYRNLLFGDGASLFRDGLSYESAATAREKNAIFFLDLDSFRYSDFTQAVGKLFIHDIRHIISTEQDMGQPKRIIMDELGSYATESLMPIFSQSRSYGYQIIVATQSLADLDAVSETFSERVLENCNQYLILQLNSSKDAERVANIIGTYETIETTRKSSGSGLDPAGTGTKKIVHEYKVSPDTIKELPPLKAIYYNKRNTDNVQFITVPFVEPDIICR